LRVRRRRFLLLLRAAFSAWIRCSELRAFANYLHIVFTSFLQFTRDSHRSCSTKQQRRIKLFFVAEEHERSTTAAHIQDQDAKRALARCDFPHCVLLNIHRTCNSRSANSY
jgi:hypothetical protein